MIELLHFGVAGLETFVVLVGLAVVFALFVLVGREL